MRKHRFGWRRIGVLIAVAGAIVIAGASPASAHDDYNDYFKVAIQGTTAGAAPETYAGDANATITVTVTNLAYQKLGSANVTVPSPFTVVSATGGTVSGQVLQLRNLNLAKNASKTATLTVDVRTCAPAGPVTFSIAGKKTSDFSGSSSFTLKSSLSDTQVSVTGQCALAFATQPKNAKKSAVITSVAFDPAGAPVKVIVVDATPVNPSPAAFFTSATPIALSVINSNVPAPIFGGTTSVVPTGGAASFAPTLGVSAPNYTFKATSADFPASSPTSDPFEIVDNAATCTTGPCATSTTSTSGTAATVNFGAGTTATNLTLSVGAAGAPTFECNNYPRGNSQVSQFAFTDDLQGNRVGTFSVTIPNASWFVIIYQVCWASPVDFYTKSGKLASAGTPDIGDGTPKPGSPGQTLKVGLLPNCKKWWWNDHWDWDDHWGFPNPSIETLPCISSRSYNWSTKAVTIEVKTTGADPWRY